MSHLRGVSLAVEQVLYTDKVGGSIPSLRTRAAVCCPLTHKFIEFPQRREDSGQAGTMRDISRLRRLRAPMVKTVL
jgi:hypothetical protein